MEQNIKEGANKAVDLIEKINNNTDLFSKIIILIVLLIVFILVLWVIRMILLQNNLLNCTNLDQLYKTKNTFISSFSSNGKIVHNDYKNLLYDYYIKSAYNCCCGGQPTNSFVSLCALEESIKQGYRFLDFEIYSIDNKPVVSSSSQYDFRLKETYNYLDFDKTMEKVSSFAFSSACPNNYDPLLLHFRVMSNHKDIFDKMAESIVNHLSSYLLGPEYGFENNGVNLGTISLEQFINKIIIVVDKSNPIYIDTKLDELVNITSNSIYLRLYRNDQLNIGNYTKDLIEFNKYNMTVILPELSRSYNNYNPNNAFNQGCQFVAMNMPNFDKFLEYYNKLFDDNNSAFVLKPPQLRGNPPVTVEIKPPNPLLKQGPKTTTLPTGHTITL